MARGTGGAGAGAGGGALEAAADVATGAEVQAVAFPNASPATTHGVVSELIRMLLPGGCVMAIVALEEDVAGGVASVPVGTEPTGLLVAELAVGDAAAATGAAVAAAGGELPLGAAVGAGEVAGIAVEEGVGLEEGAEGEDSAENAVATSEDDK
jgi:hypothetical protein